MGGALGAGQPLLARAGDRPDTRMFGGRRPFSAGGAWAVGWCQVLLGRPGRSRPRVRWVGCVGWSDTPGPGHRPAVGWSVGWCQVLLGRPGRSRPRVRWVGCVGWSDTPGPGHRPAVGWSVGWCQVLLERPRRSRMASPRSFRFCFLPLTFSSPSSCVCFASFACLAFAGASARYA